jgi:hypothetical protein
MMEWVRARNNLLEEDMLKGSLMAAVDGIRLRPG